VQGVLKPLRSILATQQRRGLYRHRYAGLGCQGVWRTRHGRRLLSFSSNDYLGLANHPEVVAACVKGAQSYGTGAGASCLVDGYTKAHQELEESLAHFVARDRALVFSSGYMANLGLLSTLADRHTAIYADKHNHASLVDAALLSRAKLHRYPHRDTEALDSSLRVEQRAVIVASDAVFSMSGDIAPLPALSEICSRNGATLVIDDAHGLGVLGETGGGSLEHFALSQKQVPVMMGTLGKALGAAGAFVAASHDVIELLIQKARTYIYTTALPPPVVCAAQASLDLIQSDRRRGEKLHSNIQLFRALMAQHAIDCLDSNTAIQGVVVGAAEQAMSLSAALAEVGLLVVAIRPPTVPVGSARLRIMLSAAHNDAHITRLVENLAALLRPR